LSENRGILFVLVKGWQMIFGLGSICAFSISRFTVLILAAGRVDACTGAGFEENFTKASRDKRIACRRREIANEFVADLLSEFT
jgi:hypothetical protein